MRFLLALAAFVAASPVVVKSEEIAWRYVTIGYSDVMANPFTPELSKGLKLCTTGSWSVENSGYPDAAKGWSVARLPIKKSSQAVRVGICDFAAIRWDQPQYHATIKQYIANLTDIPALKK